jgi:hypothetical protein
VSKKEASTSEADSYSPFSAERQGEIMGAFQEYLTGTKTPGKLPEPDRVRKYEDGTKSYNGLEYKGPVRPYKKDDPPDRQPQLVRDPHIQVFCTDSDEDMEEYREVFKRVVAGRSVISFEEKVYDPDIKGWRILLRWMDIWYTAPKIQET